MTTKKTLVADFIQYLRANQIGSTRLLNTLKNFNYFGSSDFVEDITESEMYKCRNAGKKTISEFIVLRQMHLRHAPKREILCVEEDEENEKYLRKKYECLLRYDVIKALNTIHDERYFIEKAILEKFERDGIQLPK